MKARIQKWGNSLALRIPKVMAAEARMEEDTAVELSLQRGRLVIQPLAKQQLTLAALLAGITDNNLHEAWDTGPPVGKEML